MNAANISFPKSPSSRRAWIEIVHSLASAASAVVALLAEGVDRNILTCTRAHVIAHVALLAEGVDRNSLSVEFEISMAVSPSSRRAWIEIRIRLPHLGGRTVALLAEGVDRNPFRAKAT